jgi:hypothetical protein
MSVKISGIPVGLFLHVLAPVFLSMYLMAPDVAIAQVFTSGSTGADGPFNPTQNVTITLPPSGIMNFTSVTIPRGVTVRLQPNPNNTPAVLLATGDVLIEGTLDATAPGSLVGGIPGNNGMGPGGGRVGDSGGGGGGGGFGTAGRNGAGSRGGAGGTPYALRLPSLAAGSGGGSGGNALGGSGGGMGGRGGGAVLLATTGTLTINGGTIDVRGAKGQGGTGGSVLSESGGGGGGSGGAILLRATTVAGRDWQMLVQGGTGGPGSRSIALGGEGGMGQVRVESFRTLVQDNAPWGAAPQGTFPSHLTAGPPNIADQQKYAVAKPACTPVINEILTGTAATGTEEFVEIFNPCPVPISLDGWRLVYRSANNATPATAADSTVLSTLQGTLPAGGYLVFGGPGYHGPAVGPLQGGIAPDGAVGLRDRDQRLVDSVGYGQVVVGNAFIEGLPATPAPPLGLSISRSPDGHDTNDNSRDFRAGPPTPMVATVRPDVGPGAPPAAAAIAPIPGSIPGAGGQPAPGAAADRTYPWGRLLPAAQRFQIVLNGAAVLDRETELVWERAPEQQKYRLDVADGRCHGKAVGQRFGWRVPTAEELASLLDPSVPAAPRLPAGHPFTSVPDGPVWTTTPLLLPRHTVGPMTWVVSFTVDFQGLFLTALDSDSQNAVWCVRRPQ